MTWGNPEFDDSFRRSYTSATNPSADSRTQLSAISFLASEVPGGVIVTTLTSSPVGGSTAVRMVVNGTEINDEFVSSLATSVLRVVATSSTTATAVETFYTGLVTETVAMDVPWNAASLNTISCEGLNTDNPSFLTLTSSVAVSIPSIAARRFVKLDPSEDAQGGVDFVWSLRSENAHRSVNVNITDDRPLAVTSGMSIP